MPKTYDTADDLPAAHRQIAVHFANPHSLIYDPLDTFYDFLQGPWRAGAYEKVHGGPTRCSCDVCAAWAGRPRYVQPVCSSTCGCAPDWVLWGDGHYAVDVHNNPITAETPCEGQTPGKCSCNWCRPYCYDPSLTRYQALRKLMDFLAPLVVAARGRRLEQEKAAFQARLAEVERELENRTYQVGLI